MRLLLLTQKLEYTRLGSVQFRLLTLIPWKRTFHCQHDSFSRDNPPAYDAISSARALSDKIDCRDQL